MTDLIRAMAIDYGEARIGLAVSDELGFMAHPLETVDGRDKTAAIDRIAQVVCERKIETLLMGLPFRMDGTEGTAVKRVRDFLGDLKPHLPPDLEIIEADERLTTVIAMEKLHAAGRTEKNSRDRIDQAAAVEILQEYLDGLPQNTAVSGEEWDD